MTFQYSPDPHQSKLSTLDLFSQKIPNPLMTSQCSPQIRPHTPLAITIQTPSPVGCQSRFNVNPITGQEYIDNWKENEITHRHNKSLQLELQILNARLKDRGYKLKKTPATATNSAHWKSIPQYFINFLNGDLLQESDQTLEFTIDICNKCFTQCRLMIFGQVLPFLLKNGESGNRLLVVLSL